MGLATTQIQLQKEPWQKVEFFITQCTESGMLLSFKPASPGTGCGSHCSAYRLLCFLPPRVVCFHSEVRILSEKVVGRHDNRYGGNIAFWQSHALSRDTILQRFLVDRKNSAPTRPHSKFGPKAENNRLFKDKTWVCATLNWVVNYSYCFSNTVLFNTWSTMPSRLITSGDSVESSFTLVSKPERPSPSMLVSEHAFVLYEWISCTSWESWIPGSSRVVGSFELNIRIRYSPVPKPERPKSYNACIRIGARINPNSLQAEAYWVPPDITYWNAWSWIYKTAITTQRRNGYIAQTGEQASCGSGPTVSRSISSRNQTQISTCYITDESVAVKISSALIWVCLRQ